MVAVVVVVGVVVAVVVLDVVIGCVVAVVVDVLGGGCGTAGPSLSEYTCLCAWNPGLLVVS